MITAEEWVPFLPYSPIHPKGKNIVIYRIERSGRSLPTDFIEAL